MPTYSYKHPKTNKIIEVVQKMNDKHEYFDEKGIQYERIFECSNLSKDQSIDEFSSTDFSRKTREKNYNLGEMWKVSQELSNKRKSKAGKDEIKEKHLINKYENRTAHLKKNPNKKISD